MTDHEPIRPFPKSADAAKADFTLLSAAIAALGFKPSTWGAHDRPYHVSFSVDLFTHREDEVLALTRAACTAVVPSATVHAGTRSSGFDISFAPGKPRMTPPSTVTVNATTDSIRTAVAEDRALFEEWYPRHKIWREAHDKAQMEAEKAANRKAGAAKAAATRAAKKAHPGGT